MKFKYQIGEKVIHKKTKLEGEIVRIKYIKTKDNTNILYTIIDGNSFWECQQDDLVFSK